MPRKRDKFKRVLKAIQNKADADDIFILSSSVAYHSFLSFIPIISVLVGIYLILNFNLDWGHFSLIQELVPPGVYQLIEGQANRINENLDTVNIATAFSFLISLWLANNVTRSLAHSLNIVFCRKNEKHFLFSLGESILYTLLLIISFLFLGFMLTVLPIVFSFFEFSERFEFVFILFQWAVVSLYMVFGLCFVYKYLPEHRRKNSWHSFLPGAIVATVFGSTLALLFSFYVSNFGSFNKVYGALGVIIITLLWLRLTFASVLFGGEVNYFLLKDPSLREYYRFKNIFMNFREEGTHGISWPRVFLAMGLLLLLCGRIYFPTHLDKKIRSKLEDFKIQMEYEDIDVQTLLGDYQVQNCKLHVDDGFATFKYIRNDIGWLALGLKKQKSSMKIIGAKVNIELNSLNQLVDDFDQMIRILGYGSLTEVSIHNMNLSINGTKIAVNRLVYDFKRRVLLLKGSTPQFKLIGQVGLNNLFEFSINHEKQVLKGSCLYNQCPSRIGHELVKLSNNHSLTKFGQ